MIRNKLIGFYNKLGPVGMATISYFFYLSILLLTMTSDVPAFSWMGIPLLVIPFNVWFVSREDLESAVFTANASVALFLWTINVMVPFATSDAILALGILMGSGVISFMKASGVGKIRVIQLLLPTIVVFVVFAFALLLGTTGDARVSPQRFDRNVSLLFLVLGTIGRKTNGRNKYVLLIGLRSSYLDEENPFGKKFFWVRTVISSLLSALLILLFSFDASRLWLKSLLNAIEEVSVLILLYAYEWLVFKDNSI